MKDICLNATDIVFVDAVLNIDVEKFEKLLKNSSFNKELLHSVCIGDNVFGPIYWLTLCWEIILEHPTEWKIRERIEVMKENNQKIKNIFLNDLNVEMRPLDFTSSSFYRYMTEEEWGFDDDTFEYSLSELKAMGCRKIDLMLNNAVFRMDFEKVRSLLEQGADSHIIIPGDDCNCIENTLWRRTDYEAELNNIFDAIKPLSPTAKSCEDIYNVYALASMEEIHRLLTEKNPLE